MLKGLIQKLQRLTREPIAYDPSGLNDAVALQTEWTPAKRGGASFRTHKLVEVDSFRLEFRASAGAIAFYLIFFLVGIGVLGVISYTGFSSGTLPLNEGRALSFLLPLFIGLVFACVGGCMLYFGASPSVFDKRRGDFWRGRTVPYNVLARKGVKDSARLEEIHALQLISELCRSNDSSFYSYELNLVLENGSRINVVDHGNLDGLREDADTLSAFLEKPVWDAT